MSIDFSLTNFKLDTSDTKSGKLSTLLLMISKIKKLILKKDITFNCKIKIYINYIELKF